MYRLLPPLPGQRLLHFEGDAGQACFLLSNAVPGRSADDWLEAQPERGVPIVQALAGFLSGASRAAHQYLSV